MPFARQRMSQRRVVITFCHQSRCAKSQPQNVLRSLPNAAPLDLYVEEEAGH